MDPNIPLATMMRLPALWGGTVAWDEMMARERRLASRLAGQLPSRDANLKANQRPQPYWRSHRSKTWNQQQVLAVNHRERESLQASVAPTPQPYRAHTLRRCSGAGGATLPATSTRQGTCTQSAALATSPALSPVTKVGAWGIGDRGTHLADVRSLDMPCSRPTSYRCLDENLGAVTGLDPLGAARTRAAGHLAANYSASTSAAAKREIPSAISTHRASAYRRRARWIRYGCLSVSTQASIAVRTQTALIASIFDSRR